ncbi:MAG: preprotein translocase subunit SecE [Planctomycetota bacterium]|nr:MAG: preprotein translocase subunit SecE [Planctomycetota bacterium]
MLGVYRKGQGKWARLIAAGCVLALVIYGAWALHDFLVGYDSLKKVLFVVPGLDLRVSGAFIIAAVLFAVFGFLVYYFLTQHKKVCDFLIETEIEMKKVTWPGASEVWGSTLIVLATVVVFALWAVVCDYCFSKLMYRVYTRKPFVTTTSLPDGVVGKPYNFRLKAKGGEAPYVWDMEGKLPEGLKFDVRTGTISGTPKEAGRFRLRVRLMDAADKANTADVTLIMDPSQKKPKPPSYEKEKKTDKTASPKERK